jgi:tRNA (guanine37-N1)-methyltransferase
MKIDAITIFPEYFAPLQLSLLGKAQESGLLSINVHDLRAHTTDVHHTVDDAPYGGGAGMVMLADVWGNAIDGVLQR